MAVLRRGKTVGWGTNDWSWTLALEFGVKQGIGMSVLRGVAGLLGLALVGQLVWPARAGSAVEVSDAAPLWEDRVIRIGDALPDLPVTPVESSRSGDSRSMPLSAAVARSSAAPCTFLIVYSTTCGACRRAAGAWAKAPPTVRTEFDAAVLWLSLPDSPEKIEAFHQEFGLPSPGYVLASADQAGGMGVIGTPTVYAVDRSLRVVRMPGAAPEELVRGAGAGAGALDASCRALGA